MQVRLVLSLFVVTMLSSLVGCAFAPQAVIIKPQVVAPSSAIGGGQLVALNVIDERPKQTLGTRGVGNRGADLTIEGDLTQIVRSAIAEGLAKQSFRPASSDDPSTSSQLRVEIRNLEYTAIMGFWAGTVRVDVGLKANCVRGLARPYEKLFRGEHVESVQIVQTAENNNLYVSDAVSVAVSELLKDSDLMKCLAVAEGPGGAAVQTPRQGAEMSREPKVSAGPAVGAPPPSPSVAASPVSPPAQVETPRPPISQGQDSFSAEKVAREQACSASPRATLVAKGPGYESFSVACTNGDTLAIRCEFGNCRVLK